MAAVLASPLWAGIGIRYRDPVADENKRLEAAGWTVHFGRRLSRSALGAVSLLRPNPPFLNTMQENGS
jgi:hypothetical protein